MHQDTPRNEPKQIARIEWVMLAAKRDCGSGSYFKKLFFAVNKRVDVVGREFEAMTVRDGIGRARFHAITAEDAARVIDVVHAGIALARGNAVCVDVFRGFDVNAICRASRRTQEAANTLFKTTFIAVQDVDSAVARLKMHGFVRIVFRDRLTKHVAEGYAEALHQRAKRLAHFPNDRCHKLRV